MDQDSALRVKLSDIMEGLTLQTDDCFFLLNLTTGQVVTVTTEDLHAAEKNAPLNDCPAWQYEARRLARDIVDTDHYLPLPTLSTIQDYSLMERFCLAVEDDDLCDELCDALRGPGASQRFKDRIQASGMTAAWYRYREAALQEIAVAWCEAHDIRYTET